MLNRRKRILAWYHYLRTPIRRFLPLLGLTLALVVAGGVAFHLLYRQENLSLGHALYITYSLIFMEHLLPYPKHWVLQAFYFALPPIGLAVILDGIVRFSYHILRRDESGKEWVRAVSKTLDNHVILFGLGKVGLRVLQQLVTLGEQAIVLERNEHCPNFAYARKHGVPTLVGTGREEGILDELGVERAKSIICATDDDLANLELAIDARKANTGIRVVLRMYDQELAEKLGESVGIKMAFSTAGLAAPLFATASSDRSIINAFYVDDRLLVVSRFCLGKGSELVGRTVSGLAREFQLVVVSMKRGEGVVFHPPGETALDAGDILTVECDTATLKVLHRLNRDHART